ncbi:hypothetical protein, partial [Thermogutta sp.]|uniref:hypothetical protein n=1 Tax=Thermogutta sp. TaxID=1962930 RepID=UPI0032208C49
AAAAHRGADTDADASQTTAAAAHRGADTDADASRKTAAAAYHRAAAVAERQVSGFLPNGQTLAFRLRDGTVGVSPVVRSPIAGCTVATER